MNDGQSSREFDQSWPRHELNSETSLYQSNMHFAPRYIVGPNALKAAALGLAPELAGWLRDKSKSPSLPLNGICIDLLTVTDIDKSLGILIKEGLEAEAYQLELLQFDFLSQGAVLPLRPSHLSFIRNTLQPLAGRMQWRDVDGSKRSLTFREMCLVATAMRGPLNNPIWLIDLPQPSCYPLLEIRGLQVMSIEFLEPSSMNRAANV